MDHHNIASRAAQSNSVYVSVLKIPIYSTRVIAWANRFARIFFSRERPLLILYLVTIIDTNRDSAHQSQNKDNFSTFSLRLEFLNEAEKEKNNGKGDSASVPSRFASLNNHFWYCCLFFASDLMHNSTSYVIKQLVHAFSCTLSSYEYLGRLESTQEARVALGYRLGQLLRFFRALQTSRVLHNSIVHAKTWTNW